MQSIEKTITEGCEIPSSLSYCAVHLRRGRSQGKQSFRFQTPFQSRCSSYLILQRLARDPVHSANANQCKNVLNGFRLLANSRLRLVVGEPAQATGVEVDLHECSRPASYR